MLTVTDAAAAHLADLLAQREVDEGEAFRLLLDGQMAGVETDSAQPDDLAFVHLGRPVLLVEPAVAEALTDQTLDARQTGEGMELTLR